MSNYDVNVNFKVDSSGLGKAQQEVDKVTSSLKNAATSAAPVGKGIKAGLAEAATAASGVSSGFAGIASAASAAIAPMTALAVAAGPITIVATALAAVGVAATGVFNVVTGRLSEINAMADAMDNLGGRTQGLAELFAVMEVSGEGFEKTAASLQKFQNNIAGVVESGDEVAAALGRAGIDMRKLAETAKTDVAAAYKEVITSLDGINDKNDLALIKQKLLGKSLAETAQIANDAADYEEKLALARSIGLVQTEEQKKLAQELDGAWDELKAAGKGLATQLVDMFGPTVVTMIKGVASSVVFVAQSMNQLNTWIRNTFGSLDALLRKFVPIYNIATKLFALTGKAVSANAPAQMPMPAPQSAPVPVVNETNSAREKAAAASRKATSSAESAAAKAAREADAARKRAAEEAKRAQDAYNNALQKTKETALGIAQDAKVEGLARDVEANAPRLVEQFNAAASAAKSVGLIVDSWAPSADGLTVTLNTLVGPEMEKVAKTAGKTTEELKAAALAAVTEAETRARVNNEAKIHQDIVSQITTFTQQSADANAVINELTSGRITTEEQLTSFLADQAFSAQILKMEKEGALKTDIEALKVAREKAIAEGRASQEAQEKFKKDKEDTQQFWKDTTGSFVNMFVDGLAKGKVAWKEWLQELAMELLKSYLIKMLSNYFMKMGGGFANGGAFSGGTQFFANGGVVSSPTAFGMSGGRIGIMGEAGPEAIMPLTRGPNGKLGVKAHGGGGGSVVHLGDTTINVQSSENAQRDDAETARAIDKMLQMKMDRWLAEQRRSGNPLNPNFGSRY